MTSHPFSRRAVPAGLGLSLVIGLGDQYAADRLGVVFATYAHLPTGLLVPFFLLVFFPNFLLRKLAPSWALQNAELLVVFAMGLVASMAPDWGITRYLVSAIASPAYYASPENRWDEYLIPYLPSYAYLSPQGDAVRGFFEGLRPGQTIPWGAWVVPLFWWVSLIGAVLLVGACLVVIFRKQWVEYERLRFPMGEVALRLIGQTEEADGGTRLWRNGLFLTGFGIVFTMMGWNCISYWGVWPRFPIMPPDLVAITVHPSFPTIPIYFNIYVIAFAFFAPAEILFSLWVMQLFGIAEQGVLNLLGVASTSQGVVPAGLVGIQFMGGILVFVGWMVWIARRHLKDVWQTILRRSTRLDDTEELFSYRGAIAGFLLGSAYILFWLHRIGVSLPVGFVFLIVFYIFYLALARVTAESGLVMAELTVKANEFTVGVFGSANLAPPDLVTMSMANGFARNWRSYSLIGFFHAAWLQNRTRRREPIGGWLFAAIGVSLAASVVSMIHSGYTLGGNHLFTTPGGFGTFFYDMAPKWTNNASHITGLEGVWLLSGVLLNGLIIAGRYITPWWPLHPVGMAVGDVGGVVRNAIVPLFLAWLTQILLLKFGGATLYQRAQPFFIGLLVGFVTGVTMSFIVDMIWFPAAPHQTEWF